MEAGFTARLRADGVTFDGEDADLLRTVERTGSLRAAAEELGRSRARAHARLDDLEAAFGPLVERHRGGPEGGGSRLTSGASDLLERFDRLESAFAGTAAAGETVFSGRITGRTGELAIVKTPAGRIRALAPHGADRVQAAVRADSVTIHDPAQAPPAGGTSARNRFEGVVRAVDRGEAVARVTVDVGGEDTLVALVTGESVDRLGMAPGNSVVATFKATATRAVPRGG